MGTCVAVPCCETERNAELDLPPPYVQGNDYQKFELSLPFCQTYAHIFAKRVQAAAEIDKTNGKGDGSTVTLESLRTTLCTPAWIELKKDNSKVTKVINSFAFKNEDDEISVDKLMIFAILNCPDDCDKKSKILYELLQDGGEEKHF